MQPAQLSGHGEVRFRPAAQVPHRHVEGGALGAGLRAAPERQLGAARDL